MTTQTENINSNQIQFKPAQKSDSRTIASLYSIASDGVADYIWTKLAQLGEDILDVGQRRYEREDTLFSYQNCTLAIQEETILGMLVAFPMFVDENAEPEEDPVLVPFYKLEEDNSYYICGLALFPEYRRQGIGTKFMKLAESHAIDKGFRKLSLIVFEQNIDAKRLYDRLGYHEVTREKVVPHPLIHYSGEAILMVKEINSSTNSV